MSGRLLVLVSLLCTLFNLALAVRNYWFTDSPLVILNLSAATICGILTYYNYRTHRRTEWIKTL